MFLRFPHIDKAAGRDRLMGILQQHGTYKEVSSRQEHGLLWHRIDCYHEFLQGTTLHSHLKAEPGAFVALPVYITPGKPVDILGIADAAGKIEFYCSVSSCFGLFGPMVLR